MRGARDMVKRRIRTDDALHGQGRRYQIEREKRDGMLLSDEARKAYRSRDWESYMPTEGPKDDVAAPCKHPRSPNGSRQTPGMRRCMECENYRAYPDGPNGGKYGRCILKAGGPWEDRRNGHQKACKQFRQSSSVTGNGEKPNSMAKCIKWLEARRAELKGQCDSCTVSLPARAKNMARLEEVEAILGMIKEDG